MRTGGYKINAYIDTQIHMYADYVSHSVSGAVFLYFDSFYSFILADNIVISLSFFIIYGNLLKYKAVTAQHFQ